MSVYEADEAVEPRRVGWPGWVAVGVMFCGVLAVLGWLIVSAGGGSP